jgi:hypothetical protein
VLKLVVRLVTTRLEKVKTCTWKQYKCTWKQCNTRWCNIDQTWRGIYIYIYIYIYNTTLYFIAFSDNLSSTWRWPTYQWPKHVVETSNNIANIFVLRRIPTHNYCNYRITQRGWCHLRPDLFFSAVGFWLFKVAFTAVVSDKRESNSLVYNTNLLWI